MRAVSALALLINLRKSSYVKDNTPFESGIPSLQNYITKRAEKP
jgi:hypothetical protein